jgi:hypothetical protein
MRPKSVIGIPGTTVDGLDAVELERVDDEMKTIRQLPLGFGWLSLDAANCCGHLASSLDIVTLFARLGAAPARACLAFWDQLSAHRQGPRSGPLGAVKIGGPALGAAPVVVFAAGFSRHGLSSTLELVWLAVGSGQSRLT